MLKFLGRYAALRYCALGLVALAWLLNSGWVLLTGQGGLTWIVWSALLALGVSDLRQTSHAILRNFPVIGH